MAETKNITIERGETFSLVSRWETEPVIFKAISGISLAGGAPRLDVVGHGAPDGWRVAVNRVVSPRQINAENSPPKDSDYTPATRISDDIIELNALSPYDASGKGWPNYTSGGFIQYNTPVDMAGFIPVLTIKNKPGGTLLASNLVADGALNIVSIEIDNAIKTITITIEADDTRAIAWKSGFYELDMQSPAGVVTKILSGTVTVTE